MYEALSYLEKLATPPPAEELEAAYTSSLRPHTLSYLEKLATPPPAAPIVRHDSSSYVDIEISEVEKLFYAEQLPFTAFGHARPDCSPL